MEYGGITPVGLPLGWPILIDQRIINLDKLIVGGGFRKSKLLVKGEFLAKLPNVQVIEALGL
jgi:prolyl-tRNA editing enzyme YbaK/EbsC (Cys-tRNA(Pro) deacylase)